MSTIRDRLLRFTAVSVVSGLAIALPGWTSFAQQPDKPAVPKIQAPALVLSFEGGVPGNTIAEVLTVLQKYPELLRQPEFLKSPHTIKPGDTLCQLLADRNYPLPCSTPILNLIEQLNPEVQPVKNGLRVDKTIIVPSPPLYKYSVTTYFTKELPQDKRQYASHELASEKASSPELALILKNWTDLNAKLVDKESGYTLVRYDAYRMVLETKGDKESLFLAEQLAQVRKDPLNLKFDLVEEKPIGKLHGIPTTDADWKDECTTGKLFTSPRQYRDLIEVDTVAAGKIDANIAVASVPVTIVDVRINDSPIFAPSPPAAAQACNWTKYIPALHHSTHMAGIIASRQSALGFLGLAPNAEIEGFELLISDGSTPEPKAQFNSGQEFELAKKIALTASANPLPIYLIAMQFPASKLPPALAGVRGGNLGARIDGSRSLFVVAAGQDPPKPPIALSAAGTIFPQSLGDLRNVIVVTACSPCSVETAKLMPIANYSQTNGGRSAVHVAAPGGAPIAGWVDDKSVSAAPGTSQAAAYVAGVAAAMIGRYGDVYTAGEVVKRRLQVTSQPTKWQANPDPQNVPDVQRVGMGVVDPVLALLDPRKHWLKDQNGWRSVKIKSLSADGQIRTKEMFNGNAQSFDQSTVMRFVQTTGGSANDQRWEVYEERWRSSSTDANQATVDRVGNLVPTGGSITLCDNSTIAWSAIADLIIAEGGINAKSCKN